MDNNNNASGKEISASSCFLGMMIGGLVSLTPIGIAAGGAVGYATGRLVERFMASTEPASTPLTNPKGKKGDQPPPGQSPRP